MNFETVTRFVQACNGYAVVKSDGYTAARVPASWGAGRIQAFIEDEAKLLGREKLNNGETFNVFVINPVTFETILLQARRGFHGVFWYITAPRNY